MKKLICIDFDGVIHSYNSGWESVHIIEDPPVPGALEWLLTLIEDPEFEPVIYSSRSKDPLGIYAMKNWFTRNGMAPELVDQLGFPTQKPAAWLTIDDRAICFLGVFPTLEHMAKFKPWNKR